METIQDVKKTGMTGIVGAIGDGEFADFYGYSYSSRAQFASANEIIYINHAYLKSLPILGFSEEEAKEIFTKRKRHRFDSLDDVRERLGLGVKRLKSIQKTISFARLEWEEKKLYFLLFSYHWLVQRYRLLWKVFAGLRLLRYCKNTYSKVGHVVFRLSTT